MPLKHFLRFFILALALAACAPQPEPQAAGNPPALETSAPPTAVRPPADLLPATHAPDPTATGWPAPVIVPSPTNAPVGAVTPVSLPANYGPTYYPEGVNPLTGLHVYNPGLLNRRPMAIKVTNFPRRVRPQSGLTAADLVYEYYIENGLTRFIAVFYGNDAGRVGPVRSGRFFDEHVVRMYDAIFTFASADKRVLEPWLESDLLLRLVLPRTNTCPPLCRDPRNPDYNNLFVNTAGLGDYVAARGGDNAYYDQTGMHFQSIPPWSDKTGVDIYTHYSRMDYNHWLYNPSAGRYERYQETEDAQDGVKTYAPMYDSLTNQPVAADNVVVLMVPHEYFVKSSDTEVVKIHVVGFGAAYVYRDGFMYEATWARVGEDAPLALYNGGASTRSFPLKPGTTFFQVIGVSSTVAQKDTGEWYFNFDIP